MPTHEELTIGVVNLKRRMEALEARHALLYKQHDDGLETTQHRLDSLAEMTGTLHRRIDRIESDRVERMAELERKLVELQSGPHCAKAADVCLLRKHHEALEQLVLRLDRESHADGFDKRIGQLEDQCEEDRTDFIGRLEELEKDKKLSDAVCRLCGLGLEERIKALERCEEIQNTEDVRRNDKLLALSERLSKLEGFSEPQRQDRWHATFNAALRTAAVDMYKHQDPDAYHHHLGECVEACHRDAVMQADRAHGPLEAKAPVYPDGMPIEQDTLPARPPFHVAQERANAHTAFAPNVEALVKAARRAYDVTDADTTLWAELRNALKPFETEHGE